MGETVFKSASSSVPSEGKILSRYLGSSRKSCHDFCKYGRKHTFESQGDCPVSSSFSKSDSTRKQIHEAKIQFGKNRKQKPHADCLNSSSQSVHPSSARSMSSSVRKGTMQINLADDPQDSGETIDVDEKHIDVPISDYEAKESSSVSPLPEKTHESLTRHKRSSKTHRSSKSSDLKETSFTAIGVLVNSSMSNASGDCRCTTDEDTPCEDLRLMEIKGSAAEMKHLAKASEEERADILKNPRIQRKIGSSVDVDNKNHIPDISVVNNGAKRSGSRLNIGPPAQRNGSLRRVQPDDLQSSRLQKQKPKSPASSRFMQGAQSYSKSQSVVKEEVLSKLSMSNESVDSCCTISHGTIFKDIKMLEIKEDGPVRSTEKELLAKSPPTNSRPPHNIESHTDVDEKHVTFPEPEAVEKSIRSGHWKPACKDIRALETKEETMEVSTAKELSLRSTQKHKIASSPETTLVSVDELVMNSPLSDPSGGKDGEFEDIVLSVKKNVRRTSTSLKPFFSSYKNHGTAIWKPVNSKDKMLPAALSPSPKSNPASTLASDSNSKPLVTKAEVSRLENGRKKLKDTIQITGKRENAPSSSMNTYLGSRNRYPKPSTNSLPSSPLLSGGVGFKATKFKEDLLAENWRKDNISPSVNGSYNNHHRIQKKGSQATPSSSSPSSRKENPVSRGRNNVIQLQEKGRRRRSSVFHPQVKEDSPHKLRFRRGMVIGEPDENNTATRLGFRQGTVLQTRDSRGKLWRNHSRRRSFGIMSHVASGFTAPSVRLRRQDVQSKKEMQDYNQVIEETANKLVESRKSKVKALVGAFETVISLQDAKPVISR